jgi:hypothetical protein
VYLSIEPWRVNRDYDLLMPELRALAEKGIAGARRAGYPVYIFEGFRSPIRQDYLYAQGRTKKGRIVTNAQAWESWHQYGMAFDIAFKRYGKWSWDFNPQEVTRFFEPLGLVWGGPRDGPHYQWTRRLKISEAREVTLAAGVQSLWVEARTLLG